MRFIGTGGRVTEDALACLGAAATGAEPEQVAADHRRGRIRRGGVDVRAAGGVEGAERPGLAPDDLDGSLVRGDRICAFALPSAAWLQGCTAAVTCAAAENEVIVVGQAVALTAGCLLATGPVLMGGLPAWPEQIPACALLAVAAMLGARYAAFAMRLRSVSPAPAAVKIIVFGAGEAGTQLIHRLAMPSAPAYRPVAILDDDPAKRGCGSWASASRGAGAAGRGREQTGAGCVIAIAGGNCKMIRDLTEAGAPRPRAEVIPAVR